jgi:hypothetical protein
MSFVADECQAQVTRLYHAAFGRTPDASGLSYWTSKLASGSATLANEANAIACSPEFANLHGKLSDSAFVGQLYQDALGRAADAAGFDAWTGALAHGASRGSVLAGFSESSEAKARFVTASAQHGTTLA